MCGRTPVVQRPERPERGSVSTGVSEQRRGSGAERDAAGVGPVVTAADADLHGGKIREAAAALGLDAAGLLDFSMNVNFLGPTPAVLAAARRAVDEMAWYPLDPPVGVRRAAATFLDVSEDRVILGNGASELIFLVVACLRPRRVLIVGPTFTEYERAARAWGAEIDVLWLSEERDFRLASADLDDLAVRGRIARADLVFLCDPNNPTGALFDRDARDRLLDLAAALATPVFIDESFLAFTEAWPAASATRRADTNAIVLHSFTKILAMPGLRVGALVVSPELGAVLGPRTPPWNLNCVAQTAALAAFAERDVLAETPAATASARAALCAGLAGVPLIERILPADANFLCLRLARPEATHLVARLRDEHGILVRDLSSFPGMGPRYLRTAVRAPEDNRRLLDAMSAVASGTRPAGGAR
jgi:threonine-phosphate decarboxylase